MPKLPVRVGLGQSEREKSTSKAWEAGDVRLGGKREDERRRIGSGGLEAVGCRIRWAIIGGMLGEWDG